MPGSSAPTISGFNVGKDVVQVVGTSEDGTEELKTFNLSDYSDKYTYLGGDSATLHYYETDEETGEYSEYQDIVLTGVGTKTGAATTGIRTSAAKGAKAVTLSNQKDVTLKAKPSTGIYNLVEWGNVTETFNAGKVAKTQNLTVTAGGKLTSYTAGKGKDILYTGRKADDTSDSPAAIKQVAYTYQAQAGVEDVIYIRSATADIDGTNKPAVDLKLASGLSIGSYTVEDNNNIIASVVNAKGKAQGSIRLVDASHDGGVFTYNLKTDGGKQTGTVGGDSADSGTKLYTITATYTATGGAFSKAETLGTSTLSNLRENVYSVAKSATGTIDADQFTTADDKSSAREYNDWISPLTDLYGAVGGSQLSFGQDRYYRTLIKLSENTGDGYSSDPTKTDAADLNIKNEYAVVNVTGTAQGWSVSSVKKVAYQTETDSNGDTVLKAGSVKEENVTGNKGKYTVGAFTIDASAQGAVGQSGQNLTLNLPVTYCITTGTDPHESSLSAVSQVTPTTGSAQLSAVSSSDGTATTTTLSGAVDVQTTSDTDNTKVTLTKGSENATATTGEITFAVDSTKQKNAVSGTFSLPTSGTADVTTQVTLTNGLSGANAFSTTVAVEFTYDSTNATQPFTLSKIAGVDVSSSVPATVTATNGTLEQDLTVATTGSGWKLSYTPTSQKATGTLAVNGADVDINTLGTVAFGTDAWGNDDASQLIFNGVNGKDKTNATPATTTLTSGTGTAKVTRNDVSLYYDSNKAVLSFVPNVYTSTIGIPTATAGTNDEYTVEYGTNAWGDTDDSNITSIKKGATTATYDTATRVLTATGYNVASDTFTLSAISDGAGTVTYTKKIQTRTFTLPTSANDTVYTVEFIEDTLGNRLAGTDASTVSKVSTTGGADVKGSSNALECVITGNDVKDDKFTLDLANSTVGWTPHFNSRTFDIGTDSTKTTYTVVYKTDGFGNQLQSNGLDYLATGTTPAKAADIGTDSTTTLTGYNVSGNSFKIEDSAGKVTWTPTVQHKTFEIQTGYSAAATTTTKVDGTVNYTEDQMGNQLATAAPESYTIGANTVNFAAGSSEQEKTFTIDGAGVANDSTADTGANIKYTIDNTTGKVTWSTTHNMHTTGTTVTAPGVTGYWFQDDLEANNTTYQTENAKVDDAVSALVLGTDGLETASPFEERFDDIETTKLFNDFVSSDSNVLSDLVDSKVAVDLTSTAKQSDSKNFLSNILASSSNLHSNKKN